MAAGDYYDDPFQGQGTPPPGYHYDQSGNLVPDSSGPSPSYPDVPTLTADQVGNAGQGFASEWAPGATAPSNAPPGYHWDERYAAYLPDAPEPTGGPDPGPGPTPSPLPTSIGSFIAPFTGTAPALPGAGTNYLPALPEFHAPGYTPPPRFDYAPFSAPTGESVLQEPGFKFGLDTGLQGLEQAAAARGVLNGGGTLKDIAAWANNYGSQKYGDAYSRSANTYGMNRANAADIYNRNYQTQYVDPYTFAFQGAQAEFAPKMQGYATQAAAGQRDREFNYGAAYDQYRDQYQQYLDSQNLLYRYREPFLQG
jgi:hypothetical protein